MSATESAATYTSRKDLAKKLGERSGASRTPFRP